MKLFDICLNISYTKYNKLSLVSLLFVFFMSSCCSLRSSKTNTTSKILVFDKNETIGANINNINNMSSILLEKNDSMKLTDKVDRDILKLDNKLDKLSQMLESIEKISNSSNLKKNSTLTLNNQVKNITITEVSETTSNITSVQKDDDSFYSDTSFISSLTIMEEMEMNEDERIKMEHFQM